MPDRPEPLLPASKPAKVALAAVVLIALGTLSSCTPGNDAAVAAKSQVGVAYVLGGTTPASGFDCSGLMAWAWKEAGVAIPRTAAGQYAATRRITKAELRPGDLVFYGLGSVSHVAMYVGHGQTVQARKVGTLVQLQSIDWWASARIGFGRVVT